MNKLDSLKQYKIKELTRIRNELQNLELRKKNCLDLEIKIQDLVKCIECDVLIPIASNASDNFEYTSGGFTTTGSEDIPLAYMPGKIVHTNELLVHLGEGWFCKCSAHQTLDIIKRRINIFNNLIENLNKNEKQILGWCSGIEQIKSDDEKLVDIYEEYDEEKEKEWRIKHRENVKLQKQKEYEERIKLEQDSKSCIVSKEIHEKTVTNSLKCNVENSNLSTSSIDQATNSRPMSKFKLEQLNKKKI